MDNSQNQMKPDKIDAGKHIMEYFSTEYQGLINEHINMWNIFSTNIKLYFSILAAPFAVSAIFLKEDQLCLNTIPAVLRIMLGSIGFVGLMFTFAIIRYRLDVLLYARWLNRLRHELGDKLPGVKKFHERMKMPGPHKPNVPRSFESPPRPMAMLVILAGIANSTYIGIGIIGTISYWLILIAILGASLHFVLYRWIATAKQIPGGVSRD